MKETGLAVNITVQEITAGEATGEHLTLEMGGVISPLISGKPNQLQVSSNFNDNSYVNVMHHLNAGR